VKALAMQAMGLAIKADFNSISQAVPPAFTEYIALSARQHILTRRKAA